MLLSNAVVHNRPHVTDEVNTFKCLRNAISVTGNLFWKTNNHATEQVKTFIYLLNKPNTSVEI